MTVRYTDLRGRRPLTPIYNEHRDELAVAGAVYRCASLAALAGADDGDLVRVRHHGDRTMTLERMKLPTLLRFRADLESITSTHALLQLEQAQGLPADQRAIQALGRAIDLVCALRDRLERDQPKEMS